MSKIKRVELIGGNTIWVKPETRSNINKIYAFLKSKVSRSKKSFSTSEISRGTGIQRQQVRSAVQVMAFLPRHRVVKIDAVFSSSKHNPGIRSRVTWVGDIN